MKILTILIFSGDRSSIKHLLDDIVKLKEFNIDIKIVEWTEDKKNLKKKRKNLCNLQKKNKSIKNIL